MKNIRKCTLLFTIGGVLYAGIEILWRGRTHFSMVIAGGVCFVIFEGITRWLRGKSLILQSLIAALSVTFVELIFGVIFNLGLGMKVWDYSREPFNFLGQICLLYSFLWFVLALVALPFSAYLSELLFGASQSKKQNQKQTVP